MKDIIIIRIITTILVLIATISITSQVYLWFITNHQETSNPTFIKPHKEKLTTKNSFLFSKKTPLAKSGGITDSVIIPDAVNTVYDFYDALNKQQCEEAISIRPKYKSCSNIRNVEEVKVELIQIESNKSAVFLHTTYVDSNNVQKTFTGYVWLKYEERNGWKIQDYASTNKISKDKFLHDIAGIKEKDSTLDSLESQQATSTNNETTKERYSPTDINKPIEISSIHSFGSQKILNACWTHEELQGSKLDKEITLHKNSPDHSPPDRITPIHTPKPLPKTLRNSIRNVRIPDPQKKLVALTFDLCERSTETTGYDAEIINYLRKRNIHATFYAGGKWMRSHPEKTKQLMADPLFEIGNHAWTHGNMRVLTGKEMKEQVTWTQAQYETLREELGNDLQQCNAIVPNSELNNIPPIPLSFRYPYGTCSKESLNFMGSYGLPSIQWNIVTADPWRKQTANNISKTILKKTKPGSIIIAHANGRGWKTSSALPKFIPELKKRGYKFVTISELLAAGKSVKATDTCYELRHGDNKRYDKKVGKGTE